MGLAAGQARLLTITSRKSDCEFASMRLSHQKIALSRELADLSNEYQNSLNQSKLVYDYYGTGDISTPLSYGLLMTPSALNDFMPTLVTDSLGRVALNSKYAAAAKAAGIPQEGLSTLPSETLRNNFINELSKSGVISTDMATRIMSLPYNQGASLGGDTTVAISTKEVTLKELINELETGSYQIDPTEVPFELNWRAKNGNNGDDHNQTVGISLLNNGDKEYYTIGQGVGYDGGSSRYWSDYTEQTSKDSQLTLGDILAGDYTLIATHQGNQTANIGLDNGAVDAICESEFWEFMMSSMESLLDTGDGYTSMALDYARAQIEAMIANNFDKTQPYLNKPENGKNRFFEEQNSYNFAYTQGGNNIGNAKNIYSLNETIKGDGYIGLVGFRNTDSGHDDENDCRSSIGVSLSNVFKAYLTYFTDFMNGVSATDAYGNQQYEVTNKMSTSDLISSNTKFTIRTGVDVSSDDLAQATFYDSLFNQICLNGWTENKNIEDPEYLQQMLQNGMLYISKAKDDHYYYQGNYATDPYIREITDDTFIAQAEAKYNTEKAKLNAKEETIDLKMKNLDTEISSLTTEYDTIKNTLSKNVERSFKRYSA